MVKPALSFYRHARPSSIQHILAALRSSERLRPGVQASVFSDNNGPCTPPDGHDRRARPDPSPPGAFSPKCRDALRCIPLYGGAALPRYPVLTAPASGRLPQKASAPVQTRIDDAQPLPFGPCDERRAGAGVLVMVPGLANVPPIEQVLEAAPGAVAVEDGADLVLGVRQVFPDEPEDQFSAKVELVFGRCGQVTGSSSRSSGVRGSSSRSGPSSKNSHSPLSRSRNAALSGARSTLASWKA